MSQSRQLAAIMFTDIVGYTTLMDEDEQTAFELLKRNRQIQRPIINKYNGKWLKEMGDGVLASFPTVTDAVYCAAAIQKTCEHEPGLKLRIGIHQGEVIFEGGDVFGNGVNIASRLESLAPPGGILVSGSVYKNIHNRSGIVTTFVETRELRGVREPVKIYQVRVDKTLPNPTVSARTKSKPVSIKSNRRVTIVAIGILILFFLSLWYFGSADFNAVRSTQLTDKSIAIIPFRNLTPEEESKYFSDGMMDAILSHLSKIGDIRVISRTSMERYRNSQMSIPEIATEVKVSSILEGSVQRSGESVRIIVQLINGQNDEHMWSETYTEELKDVFKVQSEIAQQIALELQAELTLEEEEILDDEPTKNPVAYDFYLKGEDYYKRSRKKEDYHFAIQMYNQAVESDPSFALAWVGLAKASRTLHHFHISPKHRLLAKKYLDKAIALNPELLEVQLETARYYYHCEINYQQALDILEKLVAEYPNYDELYITTGHIYRRMGQFQKALDYQNQAITLSPFDWTHWVTRSYTLIILRKYLEAETNSKRAIELNPALEMGYSDLIKLYLLTGELGKAQALLSNGQAITPSVKSQFELFNGNYLKAIEVLESSADPVVADQHQYIPKSLQTALIYRTTSNRKEANRHFEKSIMELEDALIKFPEDSRIYSSLGIAYAGLGMHSEAINSGTKALSIMNSSIDVFRGFYRELDMARILTMLGEFDQVVPKLELLIQQNGYLTVELLKIDPFWNALEDVEEFRSLISRPKYQLVGKPN